MGTRMYNETVFNVFDFVMGGVETGAERNCHSVKKSSLTEGWVWKKIIHNLDMKVYSYINGLLNTSIKDFHHDLSSLS
jgi:hypothetical protein